MNGIRDYSEKNLRRIEFVKCLRGAEVPVKVIGKYVELVDAGEETLPECIELLEAMANGGDWQAGKRFSSRPSNAEINTGLNNLN